MNSICNESLIYKKKWILHKLLTMKFNKYLCKAYLENIDLNTISKEEAFQEIFGKIIEI